MAGDKLVGNNSDSGPFVTFFNALFCTGYEIFSLPNPIDFIVGFFNGDNFFVTAESAKNRLVNIKNVCENGYIAGLYNGVSDIANDEKKEATKKLYADQIIELSNYYKKLYGKYEEGETCISNTAGETGDYAQWKQYDSKWRDIKIGSDYSDTVGNLGCLVTSLAIQISRSGTGLGALPSGKTEFNPESFVLGLKNNNGFDSGGSLIFAAVSKVAPKWKIGDLKKTNISDSKKLAEAISSELSSSQNGKQKFLILKIHHQKSTQHWVAVDHVSGDNVLIYDPGAPGTTLDENYKGWVVDGILVNSADDVEEGQVQSVNNSCSSGDADLNRFIGFLAYNEGHDTCNFQGRGVNTGYGAGTLAGDAGGQTTAFGITISDKDVADSIGYTSFSDELYSGCTNKEDTERLLVATIDYLANDWTQKQIDQHGITVNQHQKYMLTSVNYGGIVLAVPIMEAIRTYGAESEQVFEAFKHSFGINYAISNGFHGLMRRRLTEYEIFMTGNYEAESSNYLTMPYIQNGLAMSKSEVMSHFPTQRDDLLEGMPFAPIDGSSVGSTSSGKGNGKLVCKDGNAVYDKDSNENESLAYPVCGKKDGTTRVLFVGNSRTYVGDIPKKFKKITESKGYKVSVTEALEGGQTLASLSSKFGDTISKSYDCVVMQEQTETYMYDRDTFLSGAQSVVSKAKSGNSDVMTYVRATWAKNNSGRGTLDAAYANADHVASSTGSQIIPDGKAFEKSASDYPNINLFADDRHQSNEGAYLSAATIFKKLYGISVSDAKYYDSLGKDKATNLLKIADEVVPDATSSAIKGKGSLSSDQRQKIIDFARSQIGVSYNYGPGGTCGGGAWENDIPNQQLSCNGLTRHAYAAAGVSIPLGSIDQMSNAPIVTSTGSVSDMAPGDIIVYDNAGYRNDIQYSTKGFRHVAIYIGDGQLIEGTCPVVQQRAVRDGEYSYSVTW